MKSASRCRVMLPMLLPLLLAGCAVPDVDDSIAKVQAPGFTAAAMAQIDGADGALTTGESQALLASVTGDDAEAAILHRHLALEEAVADSPLTADNAVTVLGDGAATFRAIAAAIRTAQQHINLEYYTIEDVTLEDGNGGGVTLGDLLVARRRDGIAINVIYDAYGSSDTPPEFFARLAEAGVNLLAYHPIDPANVLTLNDRDHRKLLVVDGSIGVVGGVNLAKSYESKSPGSDDDRAEAAEEAADDAAEEAGDGSTPVADAPGLAPPLPDEWRDTAIRIEGPAVAQLQTLFRDLWLAKNGPPLAEAGFFPAMTAKGNQIVRIIGSAPDAEIPRYYVTLISALRGAERRAWISAAYFVPTPEQKEELMAAAARGVDVRLLLADRSDSAEAIAAAKTHYSDLLAAGVKIHETRNVVLHTKTVVIDGVWSAIGSSNFDFRSVLHNAEIDAIVLGAETARDLEAIFKESMAISVAIDRESWEEERSFPQRFRGFVSRLWEYLL